MKIDNRLVNLEQKSFNSIFDKFFTKKLNNKYITGFVLLIILFSAIFFESGNVFALTAAKYGAKILNKTIVIKINKRYQLTEDVSTDIKILSERGINKYSEVVVPYSLKYQRLKLINAYTILKKVFRIAPGKLAINVVSPSFAVNYPIYSDIKYFTISMPAVETGAILHYSYQLTSFKPLIKNSVFDTVNFSRTIPVKNTSLVVYYPANMRLNIYLHNIAASDCTRTFKTVKNIKYRVLHLKFSNLPALKKENYMPSLQNYRKYISISSFSSWGKLSSRLYDLFNTAETYNKNMVSYVHNINHRGVKKNAGYTKDIKDAEYKNYRHDHDRDAAKINAAKINTVKINKDLRKISKLYYNFIKSFQYTGLGYGINGYRPVSAIKTFSDGFGDSKSLAVLFIALLKIEHIKAYPVIATSLNTSNLNRHIINPMQFDSVIVAAKIAGKTFYIFPDSSSVKAFNLPFSLAGRKALEIIGRDKYKMITLPEESFIQNKKNYIFKGKINKNGKIDGKISYIYKGVYAKFERSDLKNMNDYKKLIKAGDFLYSFIPGANIKYFKYSYIKNVKKNIVLALKFSDKNYMQGSGNKFIFHLPLPIDNSLMHLVLRNKRIYPLVIGYPFEHESKIIIDLPAKFRLFYMPPVLDVSNTAGKIFSKCSVTENSKGNKGKKQLLCTSGFISKSSRVKQKDYGKYRSLIREYLQYIKNYYVGLYN
ncbi:MAG: DUF3857 domain-containing protein [Candidatus Acididesulfobacter guangdongensis]|uniref:DUF3857 domain-containing protein n=1 Tax=Acididesulfobacter guangdongensis TaxID=2597225 RepID=A0A519BI11_ACIG2|nr:MAG: DUF3857 domain-containing protein [Candidatus Acididesulfobacter guangdongensis]